MSYQEDKLEILLNRFGAAKENEGAENDPHDINNDIAMIPWRKDSMEARQAILDFFENIKNNKCVWCGEDMCSPRCTVCDNDE